MTKRLFKYKLIVHPFAYNMKIIVFNVLKKTIKNYIN